MTVVKGCMATMAMHVGVGAVTKTTLPFEVDLNDADYQTIKELVADEIKSRHRQTAAGAPASTGQAPTKRYASVGDVFFRLPVLRVTKGAPKTRIGVHIVTGLTQKDGREACQVNVATLGDCAKTEAVVFDATFSNKPERYVRIWPPEENVQMRLEQAFREYTNGPGATLPDDAVDDE